jgi:hypothetical protein
LGGRRFERAPRGASHSLPAHVVRFRLSVNTSSHGDPAGGELSVDSGRAVTVNAGRVAIGRPTQSDCAVVDLAGNVLDNVDDDGAPFGLTRRGLDFSGERTCGSREASTRA